MVERTYVAIDLETTGFKSNRDRIIEVAAVRFCGTEIIDQFSTLIQPGCTIPLRIQQITGIRNQDVVSAPTLPQILPELLAFVDRGVSAVVAHNAEFDLGFLRAAGIDFHRPALDTFELATILLPICNSYSLGSLCKRFQIPLPNAHRALDDATATAHLFMELEQRLRALPDCIIQAIVRFGTAHIDQNSPRRDWPPLILFERAAEMSSALAKVEATAYPSRCLETSDTIEDLSEDLSQDNVHREEISSHQNLNNQSTSFKDKLGILQRDDLISDIFESDGYLSQTLGGSYEFRSGQLAMAQQVDDALHTKDHLLVEAGTGTGKSLAYLLPAAIWSLHKQQRCVIATNTIALQDQLLDKDVPIANRTLKQILKAVGEEKVDDEAKAGGEEKSQQADVPEEYIRASLLKGRSNYLCLRRLNEWCRERQFRPIELRMLAKLLVWLGQTESGDVSELLLTTKVEWAIWALVCSDPNTCTNRRCFGADLTNLGLTSFQNQQSDFYHAALQNAESAHLLIVNHALLMADIATGGHIIPPYSHLIIDEAHRLENAATEQLTDRVDWTMLRERLARLSPRSKLMRAIQHFISDGQSEELMEMRLNLVQAAQDSASLLEEFFQSLRNFVENQATEIGHNEYVQKYHLNGRMRAQPAWSEIEIKWDLAADTLQVVINHISNLIERLKQMQWERREPYATRLGELCGVGDQLADILSNMDTIILDKVGRTKHLETTVSWIEYDPQDNENSLVVAPLTVSDLVEATLIHQKESVILTGATLSTNDGFGYTKERLGLWDVRATAVASPFDYKANTLLYLPDNLPEPNHPQYQSAVEDAVVAAAIGAQGHTIALFTSYGHLRTTADAIRARLSEAGILVLQQGDGSRRRLLEQFRESDKSILLGTGAFWEGIDLPGKELQALLLARLPFAVPNDPLVAARNEEFDNPFMDYTVPDAVLRFRQGFGRLIRRKSDRGTVVLLDSRAWTKRYGSAFLDALPPCTIRRAPLANLEQAVADWIRE